MKEIWKDIPGYEGAYQASDLGKIRSLPRNGTPMRILKPAINNSGYLNLCLRNHNVRKQHYVHILVYKTFLGNPGSMQIDHIDGNKYNNKLENLQLLTQRENIIKSIKNKNPIGVRKLKNGSFQARIFVNGNRLNLGSYRTAIEAQQAYQNKLKEII